MIVIVENLTDHIDNRAFIDLTDHIDNRAFIELILDNIDLKCLGDPIVLTFYKQMCRSKQCLVPR